MGNRDYKKLIVWQKSINFAVEIYKLTEQFPPEERYGMTSQMRRATISVASNVAEGSKRGSPKEYRHFVLTALGSGAELETQLILAQKLKFIEENLYSSTITNLDEIMKMLGGLEKRIYDMIK